MEVSDVVMLYGRTYGILLWHNTVYKFGYDSMERPQTKSNRI